MSDTGYAGDGEGEDHAEEGGDDRESPTFPQNGMFPEFYNSPIHNQFFFDVPRRKSKRKTPKQFETDLGSMNQTRENDDRLLQAKRQRPKKNSSVQHASHWVQRYFVNQNLDYRLSIPQKEEIQHPFKHKDFRKLIFEARKEQTSLICSYRHILVEDAVSFSPKPRVLIESHSSHRIVHTNAAYARRYGSPNQPTFFTAPNVQNLQDLEAAVKFLFSETDSLIMYPVWGSDREQNGKMQVITHFLVEADKLDNHQPLDAVVNSSVYKDQPECWQKNSAYAVA